MFESDLLNILKDATGIEVVPIKIDDFQPLPVATYKTISFTRNTDSNLSESNITEKTIQLTIVSTNATEVATIGDRAISALENLSGQKGNTAILIARISNEIDLFFEQQRTFEKSFDITFTIRG